MAANETPDFFDSVITIDVYNVKNGKYLFSFYVPNDNASEMKSFSIHQNELIGLYEKKIVKFSVDLESE